VGWRGGRKLYKVLVEKEAPYFGGGEDRACVLFDFSDGTITVYRI
jgi:hypothetical protein